MCKTRFDEVCVTFFLPRSFVLIIITLNAWSQSPKRRHQQTRRNEAVMSLRDWRLQTQRILLQFSPISRFFTWGKTKYPLEFRRCGVNYRGGVYLCYLLLKRKVFGQIVIFSFVCLQVQWYYQYGGPSLVTTN